MELSGTLAGSRCMAAENDPSRIRPRLFTVFGGTGFLGHRVVRALLEGGHRVRIAARHPARGEAPSAVDAVERVRADLFEPATLTAALTGADGAVNATSLYVERGEVTFGAVHVEGARRLARLAAQARVPRFVQMSGIGADPDAEDSYIRARGRGEEAVQGVFPGATIIRSAVMFGTGDALVPAILRAARLSPVVPLFGSGQTRLQPVCANDVAQGIAAVLTRDAPERLYEFGGPRIFSYRELVAAILQANGKRRQLLPMPFPVWRVMAGVAQNLPGAPLTRSQVALLEKDNVADKRLPGLSDLVADRTDFRDYLRGASGS